LIIRLQNIGKKFRNEWIFRKLDYEFQSGKAYAITGSNGSGKSTLMQVISGSLPVSNGKVEYLQSGQVLEIDNWYNQMTFAAPYVELTEEFTLNEFLDFHFKFKSLQKGITKEDFIALVYLAEHSNKAIRQFSSGMKQRLKLGLAFFTETTVVFLDEPTTNLDEKGIQWYLNQVSVIKNTKLVLISSNDKREYQFCDEVLDITSYK
jgi:ABC-type multidrug transport system ATPase subunit